MSTFPPSVESAELNTLSTRSTFATPSRGFSVRFLGLPTPFSTTASAMTHPRSSENSPSKLIRPDYTAPLMPWLDPLSPSSAFPSSPRLLLTCSDNLNTASHLVPFLS
jgi:hypothetical protein